MIIDKKVEAYFDKRIKQVFFYVLSHCSRKTTLKMTITKIALGLDT